MEWAEAVHHHLKELTPPNTTKELAYRLFPLLDLTSLNDTDTETSIALFLEKARASFGHVAAVCLYPSFVRLAAAEFLKTPIKIATVVNFPQGNQSLDTVLIDISRALQDGAQEIDIVFPYERYLAGDKEYALSFINTCKAACGSEVLLKVILETGALKEITIIADAALAVLNAGADFIKTSTGKAYPGANLTAATVMLLAIKQFGSSRKGLKISGGIRSIAEAATYLTLAERIMGTSWVCPDHFRIGSSRLADEILQETC